MRLGTSRQGDDPQPGDIQPHPLPAPGRGRHGHRLPAKDDAKDLVDPKKHPYAEEGSLGMVRAITEQGDLVAIMQYVDEDDEWQPKKVFFQS